MRAVPEYVDGCFDLYDPVDQADSDNPDFPVQGVRKRDIAPIWYREEAIYDVRRLTFEQADKRITMKVRIPRWKDIQSGCVCTIDGVQHLVYNKADVTSKDGFPETELTLINPEMRYEVFQ